MNKSLIPLFVCLSCISVAQAVDYQGLAESVDKHKASESIALEKAHEALSN